MQPSLKRVLTPERITQLETTGWLLDPAFGNYAHTFPASMATSTIAAAIVATLTGIYGAKPDTIETATDWVADVTCPPRHGPTQNLAGMISDDPAVRNQLIRTCAYQPSPELAVGEPLPSLDALQKTYGPSSTPNSTGSGSIAQSGCLPFSIPVSAISSACRTETRRAFIARPNRRIAIPRWPLFSMKNEGHSARCGLCRSR